ncbi:ATP-binding protein [Sulfitobacter sp. S190]|uniref:ATP-binding protein n=1 Tax=Sulfitobacter sp. S190 TaxID=2867022 RepID=UPI0021A3E71D|nr:ATP-binding protein [Sulfitobacter sp. S190]UWR20914.1 GAF domain-containing protein [Sulfitobacter sp. S190]
MVAPVLSNQDANISADETETLRTLNAFAVDLISIPNVDDLFWHVAQNVVGRLNFLDCVIYRASEDQTELVQVAALGEKNPFGRSILNPLKIPFGEGITGKVAQSREAIIIEDLKSDDDYIPDTQLARSEICVPLVCRNRVVGVIDSEHPMPRAFGEAELEVLQTIAAMTSAKLELLAEAERSAQRYTDMVASHARLSEEITNRKALEEELHNARKLEAIGRLTGKFAHEFNNLLTVVSGNLELLEDAVTDPDAVQSWQDATQAASRGSKLIQDMLTFSRRTRLTPQTANLNEVIAMTVSQISGQTGQSFDLQLSEEPCFADVDTSIFEDALQNLIANAQDAMPQGGRIQVRTENIRHRLNDRRPVVSDLSLGDYVRVCVTDDGVGIPAQEVATIFDPFYSTKAVGAGSGLGLSMTLGFVQQSGGTIEVHTQEGKGTAICLYFPSVTPKATIY